VRHLLALPTLTFLGLSEEGRVSAWGYGGDGQLGHGDDTHTHTHTHTHTNTHANTRIFIRTRLEFIRVLDYTFYAGGSPVALGVLLVH